MKSALFILLALGFACAGRAADNWPQFRGPAGDGRSPSKDLPLTWSETENIRWKTPIHGKGWASPVVWEDSIWLTTATEDGTQLSALCLDRQSGRILQDLPLFTVEKPQFAHQFNSYSSPTPVIEAGRVYVTFGSPGTACLDSKTGKVLWQRRDLECNHYRGAGSSPILYSNLLLMNFDGSDTQYAIALDKTTGQTVWKRARSIDYKDLGPDGKPMTDGDLRKAFSTPHVAPIGGQDTLISMGAKAIYAYNPLTGAEFWRVEERSNHSASSRPVIYDGLLYVLSGWSSGQLLAIRPGKPGEVLDANTPQPPGDPRQLRISWQTKRNVAKKPGLILMDNLLFMLDDSGILACLDAKSGREHWRERVGGNYSASLLESGGRIYCLSEEGKAVVVAAAPQFKVLATNKLPDGFMASPAAAGRSLFLRTRKALYCVETAR